MQRINFTESTDEILKKIKAFGISSQGATTQVSNRKLKIFSASKVYNEEFCSWFTEAKIGELFLELDHDLYIKTRDGIIKATKYRWES